MPVFMKDAAFMKSITVQAKNCHDPADYVGVHKTIYERYFSPTVVELVAASKNLKKYMDRGQVSAEANERFMRAVEALTSYTR